MLSSSPNSLSGTDPFHCQVSPESSNWFCCCQVFQFHLYYSLSFLQYFSLFNLFVFNHIYVNIKKEEATVASLWTQWRVFHEQSHSDSRRMLCHLGKGFASLPSVELMKQLLHYVTRNWAMAVVVLNLPLSHPCSSYHSLEKLLFFFFLFLWCVFTLFKT